MSRHEDDSTDWLAARRKAALLPVAEAPPQDDLRAAIEGYIAKVEAYRVHSELLFRTPIDITVDLIKARDILRAVVAASCAPRTPAEPEGKG